MSALALATLVWLVAALPGVVLAARLGERRALGACLSVGLHAVVLSLVPALGGPWLALADVLLALALLRSPRASPSTPSSLGASREAPRLGSSARSSPTILARGERMNAAAVLLVAVSYAVLTVHHRAPRGWDPSFHCLLVTKLAHGERPTTWEPWEPVACHYTLGADALVAHVARATGLAPHEAFEQSFPAAYALVAWAALGAFRRATRSRIAARHGTLALGFLAQEMRLVYHWGGLPTVLGVALALAAAEARSWVAAGVLLGALPWLHHLSALIAWSTALVLAVALRSRAGLKALALAALLATPLVPQVLSAMSETGSTSILRFADEPRRSALEYVWSAHHWGWGPLLLFLAGWGVWPRRRARPALVAVAFLVLVHTGLDVVYRGVAQARTGEDFTALTPSRWFQLASVPLAALAGLGMSRLAGRHVALGAAAIVVASLPFNWWERTRGLDPTLFDAARWARERLPQDALVIVKPPIPSHYWWPYLLERETDATPLPASEPRKDPRVLAKGPALFDPAAARAHARARGKRLFWLRLRSSAPAPGSTHVADYGEMLALDEG